MTKVYGLENWKEEIKGRYECEVQFTELEEYVSCMAIFGNKSNLYVGKYYYKDGVGIVLDRRQISRGD